MWTPPADLDECRLRRETLIVDLKAIEAQLGSRVRTDENGERLDGHAYHDWRAKAVHAKGEKERELLQLKSWARAHGDTSADPVREILSRMEAKLDDLWDALTEQDEEHG